jgi:hypothetical protein
MDLTGMCELCFYIILYKANRVGRQTALIDKRGAYGRFLPRLTQILLLEY